MLLHAPEPARITVDHDWPRNRADELCFWTADHDRLEFHLAPPDKLPPQYRLQALAECHVRTYAARHGCDPDSGIPAGVAAQAMRQFAEDVERLGGKQAIELLGGAAPNPEGGQALTTSLQRMCPVCGQSFVGVSHTLAKYDPALGCRVVYVFWECEHCMEEVGQWEMANAAGKPSGVLVEVSA